jgi:hypothetical protein
MTWRVAAWRSIWWGLRLNVRWAAGSHQSQWSDDVILSPQRSWGACRWVDVEEEYIFQAAFFLPKTSHSSLSLGPTPRQGAHSDTQVFSLLAQAMPAQINQVFPRECGLVALRWLRKPGEPFSSQLNPL